MYKTIADRRWETYCEVDEECKEEDIASMLSQMIDEGEIPEDAKAPTARQFERVLNKSDNYWEAYWEAVRCAIREVNGR